MNKTQILAALIAGRALIDAPAKWTQGDFARDADGKGVSSFSDNATCYCTVGAAKAAVGELGHQAYCVLAELAGSLGSGGDVAGLVGFNDAKATTHADVLSLWDKAIEKVKAERVVENLKTLLSAVEAQPQEQFHLSYFRNDEVGTCGTLFCTVGLACTLPVFQEQGFALAEIPRRYRDGVSYDAQVDGWPVLGTRAADPAFGPDSYDKLFNCAGCSPVDEELGYISTYDDDDNIVANMTHKELAIARLKLRIEQLGGI